MRKIFILVLALNKRKLSYVFCTLETGELSNQQKFSSSLNILPNYSIKSSLFKSLVLNPSIHCVFS